MNTLPSHAMGALLRNSPTPPLAIFCSHTSSPVEELSATSLPPGLPR